MHDTKRPTYGTVYYPLSFLILIIIFWNFDRLIISISILVLALADAGAAIVGESLKKPNEYRLTSDKKSVEGSAAMFVITFAVVFLVLIIYRPGLSLFYVFLISGAASFLATGWEAISARGLDNLTVPMVVAFVLHLYLYPSNIDLPRQFTIGLSLAFFVAFVSLKLKFLQPSGAVGTFLLASFVFGLGGWKWSIPILTFFVLSSLLSKYKKFKKFSVEKRFEKSDTRDYGQVAANGGIAGILVILQYYLPEANLYPLFVGSIAAVTADTWGTEIGILARKKTVSVLNFRVVEPGTNGGISLPGLFAGIIGSIIICLSALEWLDFKMLVLYVTIAGFVGSLVDSLLGASVQAQYQSVSNRKLTEKPFDMIEWVTITMDEMVISKVPSDKANEFVKGFRWISNDTVNWACALTGALMMYLLIGV
jgi:uncharacterized protein (TIGR00297 family)